MSLHIEAKENEVAKRILLPGDPLRAKYIAEKYFEAPKLVNSLRGAYLYTGRYKGEEVSVLGTGMGIPSMMIYATELCRDYNVDKLIRIGTGASFKSNIKLMDIIMSQACSYTSSINDEIFKGKFAPTSDFSLLYNAYNISKEMGIKSFVGNTLCYDLLYRDDKYFSLDTWKNYGVLGGEMETAGLYTVASNYNKKALSIFTVVVELSDSTDVVNKNRSVSNLDRERALDDMIILALETLIGE